MRNCMRRARLKPVPPDFSRDQKTPNPHISSPKKPDGCESASLYHTATKDTNRQSDHLLPCLLCSRR